MTDLTIVMYHYVRPVEKSKFPGIKGLELEDFKAQLAYLRRNYNLVTVEQVAAAVAANDILPLNAALLTFDDGYTDHYKYVFPLLHDAGIQGAFFPPVISSRDARMLDVNRIHFILAACKEAETIALDIDSFVSQRKEEFGLASPDEYWLQWAKPGRFDDAQLIYIKRMLQVALPAACRAALVADLFQKYVTTDEVGFARDLYADASQLATMQAGGMYIGSHATTHGWLNTMTPEEQAREIDESLEFIKTLGSPVNKFWVMSYPYGGWDQNLLQCLRDRNCTFGVTTEARVSDLAVDPALLLPRLDTNDLPKRSS